MNLPYRSLGRNVLRNETIQKLTDFVLGNPQYISDFYRDNDGNIVHPTSVGVNSATSTGLKKMDINLVSDLVALDMEEFKRSITIKTKSKGTILYTAPNTRLKIHKDTRVNYRQCSVIVPLYPDTDYSPTLFYPDGPESDVVLALQRDQCPALIDLQTYHTVYNDTPYPRFNFQISFGIPNTFSELSTLIDNGKFFI
jgi:hypothetical protein